MDLLIIAYSNIIKKNTSREVPKSTFFTRHPETGSIVPKIWRETETITEIEGVNQFNEWRMSLVNANIALNTKYHESIDRHMIAHCPQLQNKDILRSIARDPCFEQEIVGTILDRFRTVHCCATTNFLCPYVCVHEKEAEFVVEPRDLLVQCWEGWEGPSRKYRPFAVEYQERLRKNRPIFLNVQSGMGADKLSDTYIKNVTKMVETYVEGKLDEVGKLLAEVRKDGMEEGGGELSG